MHDDSVFTLYRHLGVMVASWAVWVLAVTAMVTIWTRPSAEDVQRACRGHNGVAQVAPTVFDAIDEVVCRDGSVRDPN